MAFGNNLHYYFASLYGWDMMLNTWLSVLSEMNSFNQDSVQLFRLIFFQMFDVDVKVGDRIDNKQFWADPARVSGVSD